ncbi:hypothetical protein HII36_32480 [Nonomuraea sp. NN258]|uniref:hypothetical protein n=1 Tax=Nonomuraea antri TaxID=2730852 RepID=UPI001567D88E|nr:hypothetical protein [Nonomuraea antri]NRQ36515.1 hypothetical protein [Nonomuraea antri]
MPATTGAGVDAGADARTRGRRGDPSPDPDVVGFTSTLMQNVAGLALARRLKRLRPGLRAVFGGANCDGPMGEALHRNHRFLDFVVRGEGEQVFPGCSTGFEREAIQLTGRVCAGGTVTVRSPTRRRCDRRPRTHQKLQFGEHADTAGDAVRVVVGPGQEGDSSVMEHRIFAPKRQ